MDIQNESLVKVEIGCGTTKTEGFIGVDRFPLPGVDIVADVNKGLPFENNSVDVLFACHSLEHIDNLIFTIEEIHRVGKHKSLVLILSPYYFTSLNLANPYHKLTFNDDTTRFFSHNSQISTISKEDFECPHANTWGLGTSDNSDFDVELETIGVEYFYYEAYRHLSNEEKRHARRALLNVCDQLYYILAINKSGIAFTDHEIKELNNRATALEPVIITSLRQRDMIQGCPNSILSDIDTSIKKSQSELDSKLDFFTDQMHDTFGELNLALTAQSSTSQSLCVQVNELDNKINSSNNNLISFDESNQQKFFEIQNKINEQNELIQEQNTQLLLYQKTIRDLEDKLNNTVMVQSNMAAVTLDIVKVQEKNSRLRQKFAKYNRKYDLLSNIQIHNLHFIDGMILKNQRFKPNSTLNLSNVVPFSGYYEYTLTGVGCHINFYLHGTKGSKIYVELVEYGVITKREILNIEKEGTYCIIADSAIKDTARIRFKTLDNVSFIRILEIRNQIIGPLAKKELATYID